MKGVRVNGLVVLLASAGRRKRKVVEAIVKE